MAKKKFTYRGKTIEELQKLSLKEFMELIPARERRTLKRGMTEQQKIALENITKRDNIKTHCREMIIIPQMVGKTVHIYNGKAFEKTFILEDMMGHRLGEF